MHVIDLDDGRRMVSIDRVNALFRIADPGKIYFHSNPLARCLTENKRAAGRAANIRDKQEGGTSSGCFMVMTTLSCHYFQSKHISSVARAILRNHINNKANSMTFH